ncbi:hypothetical protein JSR02_00080 [Candidatus Vidania fulgoroideae]|uniref:Ribosomal RNA adenine methylase transferase N-terminal domain-containing protein n=1 Tax=Candidatus Vidania fulgoroideorum TaxID=881286 RepID=A0A975AEJ0_9PROT|nr:hypothetical protein JSR02_00080 [Candidatus Vidania fulgoroideae]
MFLSSDVVFLVSKVFTANIVLSVYLYKGVVIEVGAGVGNLTYKLLQLFCSRVFWLFEVNYVFCNMLVWLLTYNNVVVYHIDFLTFVFFSRIYITFVSNVPFSISTILLYKLLCYRSVIICQYLMLQIEVYCSIFGVSRVKFFRYSFYYFYAALAHLQGYHFEPVVAVATVFFVMYPKYIPYETKAIYYFIVSYFNNLRSLFVAKFVFFRLFVSVYNVCVLFGELYFCAVCGFRVFY